MARPKAKYMPIPLDDRDDGRVIAFTEEQVETFERMASCGLPMADIAWAMSDSGEFISRQRMFDYIAADPLLALLYKKCKAAWKSEIADLAREKARDETHPGSTAMIIFLAKTQLKWRESDFGDNLEKEIAILVRRKPAAPEEDKKKPQVDGSDTSIS